MKNFDSFCNALESIGYITSASKEGDTYILQSKELKKDLTIVERFNDNKQREVLLWSKAEPTKLYKVVGSGLEKVLPRLVVQHFTGLKNVVFSDDNGNKSFYEDVGFFPVSVHNGMVRFSDGVGRKWLCSASNIPNITLAFYKLLYDGRTDMSAMMMPRLERRDDVSVLKNSFGGRQVPVIEPLDVSDVEVPISSSLDDLMRSIPNLEDMMLFPHQGDVPKCGVKVMSGMAVSAADRAFIASAERRLNGFIGSAYDGSGTVPEFGDVSDFKIGDIVTDGRLVGEIVSFGFGNAYPKIRTKDGEIHDVWRDHIRLVSSLKRPVKSGNIGADGWDGKDPDFGSLDDIPPDPYYGVDASGFTSSEQRRKAAQFLNRDKVQSDATSSPLPYKTPGEQVGDTFPDEDPDYYQDSDPSQVSSGSAFDISADDDSVTTVEKRFERDKQREHELQLSAFQAFKQTLTPVQSSNMDDVYNEYMNGNLGSDEAIQMIIAICPECTEPMDLIKDWDKSYPVTSKKGVQALVNSANQFNFKLYDTGLFDADISHNTKGGQLFSSVSGVCDGGTLISIAAKDGFSYNDLLKGVDLSQSFVLPEFKTALCASTRLEVVKEEPINRRVESWVLSGKELNTELKLWGFDNPGQVFQSIKVLGVDLDGKGGFKVPVKSAVGPGFGHDKLAKKNDVWLMVSKGFWGYVTKAFKELHSNGYDVTDWETVAFFLRKKLAPYGVDLSDWDLEEIRKNYYNPFMTHTFNDLNQSTKSKRLGFKVPVQSLIDKSRYFQHTEGGNPKGIPKTPSTEHAQWFLNHDTFGSTPRDQLVEWFTDKANGGDWHEMHSLYLDQTNAHFGTDFSGEDMARAVVDGLADGSIRLNAHDASDEYWEWARQQPDGIDPDTGGGRWDADAAGLKREELNKKYGLHSRFQRLGFNKPLTSTSKGRTAFLSNSQSLVDTLSPEEKARYVPRDSVKKRVFDDWIGKFKSSSSDLWAYNWFQENIERILADLSNKDGFDYSYAFIERQQVLNDITNYCTTSFGGQADSANIHSVKSAMSPKGTDIDEWDDYLYTNHMAFLATEASKFAQEAEITPERLKVWPTSFFEDWASGVCDYLGAPNDYVTRTNGPFADAWRSSVDPAFSSYKPIQSDFKGLCEMIRGWFQRMKEGLMDQQVFYQNLMRILKGNGYPGPKANTIYKEIMDGKDPAMVMASFKPIQSIAVQWDPVQAWVGAMLDEVGSDRRSLEDAIGNLQNCSPLDYVRDYGLEGDEAEEFVRLWPEIQAGLLEEIFTRRKGKFRESIGLSPTLASRSIKSNNIPPDSELGRALEYLKVNPPYANTWEAVEEVLWNGPFGDDEDVSYLAVMVCDELGIPIASSTNPRLGFQKPIV